MTYYKLVHGTSAVHLDSIKEKGICPRGSAPGVPNVFPPTHPQRVYLTNAYALGFAMQAVANGPPELSGADLLLVEVEVNRGRLTPSEEFIGQSSATNEDWVRDYPDIIERIMAMSATIDAMEPNSRCTLADNGLDCLGVTAHAGVAPAFRLRRFSLIPQSAVASIAATIAPKLTIADHMENGATYALHQQKIMNDWS